MKVATIFPMKYLIVLFISFNTNAFELKNFETDGCTKFIDGTIEQPKKWYHCCLMHDMKYWYGGDQKAMDQADTDLYNCAYEAAGEFWANLLYVGVRTGHYSPIKLKYQWAWGWTHSRQKMQKLTPEEIVVAKDALKKINVEQIYIDRVLKESLELN